MKPSTKRALSLLASGLLLIGSLVIYATLIRPEYAEIQKLRGILASKTNLLNEEQSAVNDVGNLIAQYQGVANLGDSLALALPQDESMASIVSQLNAISSVNNLTIQSVDVRYLPAKPSPIKLSSVKKIGILRLSLKLTGSYSSLKSFLQNLEKNIRIMDLTELRIESAGKPVQDLFSYAVTFDTYYQMK